MNGVFVLIRATSQKGGHPFLHQFILNVLNSEISSFIHLFENNKHLFNTDLHVDLKRLISSNYLMQVFAVFLNKKKGHDYLKCLEYISYFKEELNNNSNCLIHVKNMDDLNKCKSLKKLGALLSIEESGILDGDISRLDNLYNLGVRMMTLTWNYINEIGYPNINLEKEYNPTFFETENGLTDFGKLVVKKMNELGIIIDVSHLSDKGFYDVINLSAKPIVASHSNSRAICNNSRNLTDDMIVALKHNRGVMGINYCKDFLTSGEENIVDGIVKHIEHIKDLGCIDVICLGSDFDG